MRPSTSALWLLLICSLALATCKTARSRPSLTANNSSPQVKYAPSEETLRQNAIYVFKGKANEVWQSKTTAALSPQSRITGKIALVWRSSDRSTDMRLFEDKESKIDKSRIEYYGFKEQEIAIKVEEIDTLIKVDCEKGDEVGEYRFISRTIPAYAMKCKVEVIDYKNRTIFAEREIINRKMDKTVKGNPYWSYYPLDPPFDEIRKYLKTLKSK